MSAYESDLDLLTYAVNASAIECSPKNETANSQTRKKGMVRLSHELHRNNLLMSKLGRRLISWHAGCLECWYQPNYIMNNQFESTYALLVRCEEKGRGVLEILVYAVFILGVALSIWQFAQTPVKISAPALEPCVACDATATPRPVGS